MLKLSVSRSVIPFCARIQTSLYARRLVQVGYRWVVFSIWGRILPLLATKQASRLLCVPYDLSVANGVGNVCNIFFYQTYEEA